MTLSSASPEETAAIAAALAPALAPGDLVLLRGEVGTGKTTFVRAAARALGVRAPVTSPTYVLAQRYAGAVDVAHVDAYRLQDPDDEELGLVLETMTDGAIAFVEWPEALAGGLPEAALTIHLTHRGGDRRLIALTAPDRSDRRLLDEVIRLGAHARDRHGDAQAEPGAGP